MTNIDPHAYTVMTKLVEIDGESYFEATVRELPDVRDYGETQQEAYNLAIDTIKTAAEMYEEENRAFPMPARQVEDYSGRITLRMLPEIHHMIDMAATSNRVSINHYVNSILTFYAGHRLAEPQSECKNQMAAIVGRIVVTNEGNRDTAPFYALKVGDVPLALNNTASTLSTGNMRSEYAGFCPTTFEKISKTAGDTYATN